MFFLFLIDEHTKNQLAKCLLRAVWGRAVQEETFDSLTPLCLFFQKKQKKKKKKKKKRGYPSTGCTGFLENVWLIIVFLFVSKLCLLVNFDVCVFCVIPNYDVSCFRNCSSGYGTFSHFCGRSKHSTKLSWAF